MDRELRNELTMDRILSPHMVAGDTAYKQPSRVCLNFLNFERIREGLKKVIFITSWGGGGQRGFFVPNVLKIISRH